MSVQGNSSIAAVLDAVRADGRKRHARHARVAIVALYVTLFGFVAPDYYAMGGNPEDLVLNHYYRGFGFMVAGVILLVSTIQHGISRHRMPFAFLVLLAMFAYYAVTGLALYGGSISEYGMIAYRIAEWLVVIVLAHQAISGADDRADAESLIRLVKLLIQLTFVIVAVYYVITPGTVIMGGDRFQLGGAAIHPNRLGFIGALGVLIFGLLSRGVWDKVFFVASIGAVLAANSRIGILMGVLAVLIVIFAKAPRQLRIAGIALSVIIGLVAVATVLTTPSVFRLMGPLDYELVTLNSRTLVWDTALRMLEQSPLVGWGFVLGPKQIGEHLRQSWWFATNAQSDVMSALVAGGYVGLLIYLVFAFALIRSCFRVTGPERQVVIGVTLLYFISSSFEPFFVTNVVTVTVILTVFIRLTHLLSRDSRRVTARVGLPALIAEKAQPSHRGA